jgi:hypothetical protein
MTARRERGPVPSAGMIRIRFAGYALSPAFARNTPTCWRYRATSKRNVPVIFPKCCPAVTHPAGRRFCFEICLVIPCRGATPSASEESGRLHRPARDLPVSGLASGQRYCTPGKG